MPARAPIDGGESPRRNAPGGTAGAPASLPGLVERSPRFVFWGVAVLLAALVGFFAYGLASGQGTQRDDIEKNFADRASDAASLTQALFGSAGSQGAQDNSEMYGGKVTTAQLDKDLEDGSSDSPYRAIFTADGRLVAASSGMPVSAIKAIAQRPPYFEAAVGPQGFGLSGILDYGKVQTEEYLSSFDTDSGKRVLVSALDPEFLGVFMGGFFAQSPHDEGEETVLLDDQGRLLASSEPQGKTIGEPVADGELLAALDEGDSGDYGSNGWFASAAVEGTDWNVVRTVPADTLFAPVRGAEKWVPWLLFGAFALVAVVVLVLLSRSLQARMRLAAANVGLDGANRELAGANAELARSNEELEQFASIASHDLREPLRKIRVFSEQVVDGEGERLSERGRDYLGRMSAAAERMEGLIEDLLQFSRVTTRGRPPEEVDLGPVVAEVLDALETVIAESGVEVEVGSLPRVMADPAQMRQLCQNLLSNAVKFSREGEHPKVRISGESGDGDWATLVVEDNGIGFEQKYSARIFRVFERLHGRGTYPGTGIGLALCRKIAERHGGSVTAEGRPGEGATFTVVLPARAPAAPGSSSANGASANGGAPDRERVSEAGDATP